ncbi:hypothetical protein SAY86_006218 [Trapa natans]|uniref:Uncharacterized protein n=1 Tax=Trapa natans TaxID=22666 RepID=A0AAN7LBM7_TRANT|nr:hypothetical protein SAY86_006218 [Trapa natans]
MNDLGENVWRFECREQKVSLAIANELCFAYASFMEQATAWAVLGIYSPSIRHVSL